MKHESPMKNQPARPICGSDRGRIVLNKSATLQGEGLRLALTHTWHRTRRTIVKPQLLRRLSELPP